ncbi:unnamed protein product [Symbiodinium sp. CCMP2592]|nr:unnamed protein product [Symbiodinium sp. CCMP2592]
MEVAWPRCREVPHHLAKYWLWRPLHSRAEQAGHRQHFATLFFPAGVGGVCVRVARRRALRSSANRRSDTRCPRCIRGARSGSDGDSQEGSEAAANLDDSAFFAAFRKRAQEVEQQAAERKAAVDRNWKDGRAEVKVGAVANDWVRRVILVDDELFVGTASRGVQRYRLGGEQPRQLFPVSGDPTRSVPADHQAEYDPETSVTSIAWNGRCLFAGLAGGRAHAWRDDGTLLLDVVVCSRSTRPCYVLVKDDMLIAAAGEAVMRWSIEDLESQSDLSAHRIEVTSNVHSLAAGFNGTFALGLEDGTVELRSLERLNLLSRRPSAHRYAVSALLVLSDTIVTGDAAGNLASWRTQDASVTPGEDWEKLWQREHRGRVVAISQGGGQVIVTAALDSFIRIWNLSGELLFAIPEHRVWLGSLSMSVDNSLMATDGRDNAVYLYRFSED